jgi:pimeloyl-ACP methyl ester carboxylesterase
MSLAQRTQRAQRDMADERRQFCKMLVKGITVAYEDVGEGDNVLVFVHGHPFNRTMWQPQIDWIEDFNRARFDGGDSLSTSEGLGGDIGIEPSTRSNLEHEDEHEEEEDRRWRAIVPDLRGYGDSTVVPGKTTLDIFASDIAGLLDELGIPQVVIGGLSMGGRAIMADRLLKEWMQPYAGEVLPKMVTPANLLALPAVADHVRAMMWGTNPVGAAAALRGRAERPDYAETLARLDVPAFIVVGDEDAFTTRADAEQMRGLLKQGELVWIEGVGHMPNLESEREFNEALGRLLRRCAG